MFLVGIFSAPTSAGVLFSMLNAAGLSKTWVFQKARILAVFDDLDVIMLMIPIKMLYIGLEFSLLYIVGIMVGMLAFAYT